MQQSIEEMNVEYEQQQYGVKNMEKIISEDELITGEELCQKLKVKLSFIYAPVRRKGPDAIPCVKIGKYLRYHLPTVRAHFARHQEGE